MSKSKGNVVTFDEVIQRYGADTLRLYTLAIGPPERDAEWQDSGIVGYHRFLNRLWDAIVSRQEAFVRVPWRAVREDGLGSEWRRVYRLVHATVKKVTEDVDQRWHFNTAIAAVMSLLNEVQKLPLPASYVGTETEQEQAQFNAFRFAMERMVQLLAPFVPHIAEELWVRLGNPSSVFRQGWPEYDEEAARPEEVELPVQVNGKLRDHLVVPRDEDEEVIRQRALALDSVRRYSEGKTVTQVVVVPNRIVSIVVR